MQISQKCELFKLISYHFLYFSLTFVSSYSTGGAGLFGIIPARTSRWFEFGKNNGWFHRLGRARSNERFSLLVTRPTGWQEDDISAGREKKSSNVVKRMKYLLILGSKFGKPETGVPVAYRRILDVMNEGITIDREKTNWVFFPAYRVM